MLRCQGRNGTDLAQECGICDTPRAYSLWSLVPIMKWMCIGVSCIGATGMESMVHRERWERDTPECDCMGTKRPYNSLNYTERRSQLVFQKDTRKRTPHRSQQFRRTLPLNQIANGKRNGERFCPKPSRVGSGDESAGNQGRNARGAHWSPLTHPRSWTRRLSGASRGFGGIGGTVPRPEGALLVFAK